MSRRTPRSQRFCRLAFLLAAAAGLAATAVLAGTGAVTDLEAGLKQAAVEKKLLFVFYGTAACTNCPAVKGWIAAGLVRVFPSDYVTVELDGDDPRAREQFAQRFKLEPAPLPWLVIATAAGTQLAARGGDVDPGELNRLLRDALKLAADQTVTPAPDKPAAAAGAPQPAPARGRRTWRSDTGRTVTGTFVEDHDGQVVIEQEDGSRLVVPLRRLSREDQEYVGALRTPEPDPAAAPAPQ